MEKEAMIQEEDTWEQKDWERYHILEYLIKKSSKCSEEQREDLKKYPTDKIWYSYESIKISSMEIQNIQKAIEYMLSGLASYKYETDEDQNIIEVYVNGSWL